MFVLFHLLPLRLTFDQGWVTSECVFFIWTDGVCVCLCVCVRVCVCVWVRVWKLRHPTIMIKVNLTPTFPPPIILSGTLSASSHHMRLVYGLQWPHGDSDGWLSELHTHTSQHSVCSWIPVVNFLLFRPHTTQHMQPIYTNFIPHAQIMWVFSWHAT